MTRSEVPPEGPTHGDTSVVADGHGRTAAAHPTPPRSALEESVAAIVAEVLGLPSVSVDDDLYALGAQSLQMIRLWARIRSELGPVELREIFAAPTVAGIASVLPRTPAPDATRPRLVPHAR